MDVRSEGEVADRAWLADVDGGFAILAAKSARAKLIDAGWHAVDCVLARAVRAGLTEGGQVRCKQGDPRIRDWLTIGRDLSTHARSTRRAARAQQLLRGNR